MSYGLIYRSEWMMMDDTTIVRVDISDTETLTDDPPTIVNMSPSGNPLVISVIDNDKNKFKQIRSKQARIEVLTTPDVGFETFADAADNRYRVDIYLNPETANQTLFFGFLSLADNQEDFLPDPNILVLTATDHLGMLKDIPLTTGAGLNPSGKSKFIDYISWALRKTGFVNPIYVVNNLRHGTTTLEAQCTFSGSGQYFVTVGQVTQYFYVGQEITISGTTSNNGNFTVTNVDNSGLVTVVYISGTITAEAFVDTTFVDETEDYFYNYYLDAKTFEDEIGTCEDCYAVLEKILGFDCFLTQYNGGWWIFRVDEWDDNLIYVTEYGYDGSFVSFHSPTNYNFTFGRDEDYKPYLADQIITAQRPHGTVKLTYNFDTPLEVPCNKDFERGDYIEDLPTETVDDVNYYPKSYNLDCWNFWKQGTPADAWYQTTPTLGECFIKRVFDENDYEKERYIVMTYPTYPNPNVIESEAVDVGVRDKVDFSFTYRFSSDAGGSFTNVHSQIRLEGTDGSIWFLDDDKKWYESDSNWSVNYKFLQTVFAADDDMADWKTYSIEGIEPIPVEGKVYILVNWGNLSALASRELHISDISLTYYPYINGSYQKYTGQYQKVTRQPNSYLAKLDDTVYISDSPRPIIKGGIFRQISTYVFKLCKVFYPYNVFPTGLADHYDAAHPYGELQIRSVMNQYRDACRIYDGSVKCLDANYPDMIYKFFISDVNPNTNNRYWMLTGFEADWKTGILKGTWVEVWKSPGKVYTDDREFKYISQ